LRRHAAAATATATLAVALLATAGQPASAANSRGQADLIRPESGSLIRSFNAGFSAGDALAMGDPTNDGADEVIVANAGGGRVTIQDAFGFSIRSFDTAYDANGDSLAVGDLTGDGADEIVIANAGGSSEHGRIDVHNLFGFKLASFDTAYDTDDQIAMGDITGDGIEELVVANTEGGGRMDVHNVTGFTIASFGNTGFDNADTFDVGDVTGDGRAEIVVANSAGGGRVDVYGGTGGLRNRWSSGVVAPKVLVAEMTGDKRAEINLLSTRVSGTTLTPASQRLGVFTRSGTRIRTVSTTFTPRNETRSLQDGIALGNLNAGPRAEIVVANR
jgi:hypothetical protein